MICEECVKASKTSKIFPERIVKIKFSEWRPYYDEIGKLHSHDPNERITRFKCTNGHKWEQRLVNKCSVRECSFGTEVPV